MNHESPDNPFRLGGRYKNRKGYFTVISFAGDEMRIRWDTGEEATDTIASQARILRNMQRDTTPTTPRSKGSSKPIPPPSILGTVFAAIFNPRADFASSTAQQCSHCRRNLAWHPIVMIGLQAFCYRCAKSEYPKLMDEARRARNRAARRGAPTQNYVPDPVVSLHPDCSAPAFIGIGYDRGFVLRRDDSICQSCGCRFPVVELEIHHVLPRAQRGSDSIRNLLTLCKQCHFHEDWFDHVHKDNQQRISQKRRESFNLLSRKLPRRRA